MATIIHGPKKKQETSPAATSQQTTGKKLWETEPSSLGEQAKQQRSAQTQRKQTSSLWQPMKTPKEFSRSHTSNWYSGDTPTASEMIARADALYGNDKVRHDEVLSKIYTRMATPGSGVYNPYRTATNSGLIDNLTTLGIDTSGGINDDFFAANAGYQKYLRRSAVSGTPSAPTKQSTNEERAAYYLYQLQKDETTTNKAETEWADMQKEISYWVGKGYSDDEVLAKVNADGKYTTLKKMDDAAGMGAPMALNRAVGYSRDAQYGAIWAARNGGGSGDAFADAVSYASGVGKGYNADRTSAARRDPTSASYMPYASGSTMDDANIYFGRNDYDQAWINANNGMMTGNDSTAAKYYKQVYNAEKTTQTAEQERSAVYAWIDAMRTQGATTQQIASALQSMYDDPGSSQAVDMTTLKKMDEARQKGDPLALTRSVDWRWEDALRYAQYGAAGSKTKRDLIARLNTVQNPVTDKGLPTVKSTATLPREAHDAARAEKAAQAPAAQDGNHLSDPAQMAEGNAAQAVAQQAEAVNATVDQQGEVDEAQREKEQAQQQRAELIDEYNTALYANERTNGSDLLLIRDLESRINNLTAQIGDGYSLRPDYTLDDARGVLEKAFAGKEDLTEDETRILSDFYLDYGDLFGVSGTNGEGFRNYTLVLDYGKTAQEALTWSDSPEATTQESVDTIMQIVQDSQSADAAGMSLDNWYEANPDAKARLMQVKDNVQAKREADAAAAEAQKKQQQEGQIAYNTVVLGKVAAGQALTDEEQATYDSIMGMDEQQLLANDPTYQAKLDNLLVGVNNQWDMAAKLGLTEDQMDMRGDVITTIESYYATDAKLAASVGMSLDEFYANYSMFDKDQSTMIEQARNEVFSKWETPDAGTEEADGLGFFKVVGLGIDSGWNSWIASKIGFYQAIATQDDNTVSAANYEHYVVTYGLAGARRAYSNDLAAAIYGMSDDDPQKAEYMQAFANAQTNGTDIFMVPFNFNAETLRQAREKFNANVQANNDLVAKYGTWAEKNLVYSPTVAITQNSLNFVESNLVGGITGSGFAGSFAGYFTPQYGEDKLEAMSRGLSSGQASLLATATGALTMFLESKQGEKYVPHPFSNAITDGVANTAKKEGMRFCARVWMNAKQAVKQGTKRLGKVGVSEAEQELLEDGLTAGIKSVAYGDSSEITNFLALDNLMSTAFNSFVTAGFLAGEGELIGVPSRMRFNRQIQQMQQAEQQQAQEQQAAPVQVEQQQQQETQQVQTQEQQTQQAQQAEQAQEQQQQTAQEQTPTFDVTEEQAQAMAATIADVMNSEDGMQQMVDARAAEITYQQLGLGAMDTQQIATLTAQAQQATTTLEAARNEQAQLRADLAKVQATLQKANKQASTPNGAKLIQRYAPRAAQLQQQLAQSRQKVAAAQTAYQQATVALETERRGRYTQIQQQAQQQARAEMVAAKKAYAETGSFKVQQQVEQSQQGQAQSQQQTQQVGAIPAQGAAASNAPLGSNTVPATQAQQGAEIAEGANSQPVSDAAAGGGNGGGDNATPNAASESAPNAPQRQFGHETAQHSNAIDQATKDWLYANSGYTQDSNRVQIDRAIASIESKGIDAATTEWLAQDESTMGNADSQVQGIVLMGIAARSGNVSLETIIADKYNRLGTVVGQGLQARKVFDLMSPIGAQAYTQREVARTNERYGTDIQLKDETLQAIGNAQTLEERQNAVDAALKEAAAQVPPTLMDKVNAWRYLAMLGNPRTHIRNIIGNAVFMPEVGIRNKISAAIQNVWYKQGKIDYKTRSTALVTDEKYREFAKADVDDARVKAALKEGEKYLTDRQQAGSIIEQNRRSFGDSKVGNSLQWASDTVGDALKAEDLVAKEYYYKRALASYLQANNVDLQTVDANTLENARIFAVREAMVNTYNNKNEIMEVLVKAENDLRKHGLVGKAAATAIEGTAPFKNTPANVVARGVEYSPAGLAKTLIVDTLRLKRGEISPHKYIDNLASGLTGTGMFLVGAGLRALGCITGSLGDDDEDKFAKMNGEQEYAIKLCGYSYTMDWLAPGGISLFTGANFYDLMVDGGETSFAALVEATKKMTDPVFNLTMLDSVNDLFGADDSGDVVVTTFENYLGQFIPSILGQIARAIDPVRRSNYTEKNSPLPADLQYFLNKQKNKIPGLSLLSTPYVDAFGRQDVSDNFWLRLFENFISPGYLNKLTEDDTTAMIEQVAQDSGEDVYPSSAAKYLSIKGQRYDLTAEQWTQYQTDLGTTSKDVLDVLAHSEAFAGLEPAYQAVAIKDAMQYAKKTAQSGLIDGVHIDVPNWIKSAKTAAEAAEAATSRAKDTMVSDYSDANAAEIAKYAGQGNLEACVSVMPIFDELGLTTTEKKAAVTKAVKTMYTDAWERGDMVTCGQIEITLQGLGLGYSNKDFGKWKPITQKESK